MFKLVPKNDNRRLLSASLVLLLLSSIVMMAFPASSLAEESYYFYGFGNNHGVGLCMLGVKNRALAGQGYEDIIRHYYTGVSFASTDENRILKVKCPDGQIREYSLRDYLYRLAEEPDSWPTEGLRTLIVSARTYTMSVIDRGKHAAEGFDICSSGGCCQAFNPNIDPATRPNTKAAVDDTAGKIIVYNGQPIIAAYSASCGGHTENNENVWGNGNPIYIKPYLRGVPCGFCSYTWEKQFTRTELENIFNSHSESYIGQLINIDLSNRGVSGRVVTAKIIGTAGTKEISGYGQFAGWLGLKSSWIYFKPDNFDEYVLLANPQDVPANVTLTFMLPGGSTSTLDQQVPAKSRSTVHVDNYIPHSEVSVKVSSDQDIVAERSMYFNYDGKKGGHDSIGATAPATTWYLAEGYTGAGFDEWVLIQNPNSSPAVIKATFMRRSGPPVEQTYTVDANSRFSIYVDAILPDDEVSAEIESTNGVGVIAERAMYFNYHGREGGHDSVGVTAASTSWYLAEGFTGDDFDEWILIQNPNASAANVEVTYYLKGAGPQTYQYAIPANSRHTIHVDENPGMSAVEVSAKVASDIPVIAERSMYFNYKGKDGGHDSIGVTSLSNHWYLGEGYTGGDFDEWILIQNPNPVAADVGITYLVRNGAPQLYLYSIPPNSRYTIHVDEIPGMSDVEVSAAIDSSRPVVTERAMYFNYRDRRGGHDSIGASQASKEWYFAEGYTGY